MFRVALKSLLGNKLRLALTSLAIVIGVAFVAGSYVLTDSIEQAFDRLFSEATEDLDVVVNGVSEVDATAATGGEVPGQEPTFDEAVLEEVRGVDGVAVAIGTLAGSGQVIGPDGEPVGGMGPPTLTFSWSGPDEPGPLTLDAGRAATGPDEATLDRGTLESTAYELGDTMTVELPDGPQEFEIVGVTGFGEEASVGGTTIVTFDLATAQAVQGKEGLLTEISVVGEDGVDAETLRGRIAGALGDQVEVVTGEQEADAQAEAINEGLSFLTIGLLVFAGVAVFVGIFLIVNTFSIIVAQRTREFGLLRAVGASSRQVRWTVVIEAVATGFLSGIVGLLAGIGLASLVQTVFEAIGFGFPAGGLVVAPRTVVVSMVIAVVVTAVASYLPARRAGQVSPMEALRSDESTEEEAVGRGRRIAGLVFLALGATGLVLGLLDAVSPPAAAAGFGAATSLIGVVLLSPYLVAPTAGAVGLLAERRGLAGRLARKNAHINPRRTATTAAALMIGVALVSFVSIFAASATASVNELFAQQIQSDFLVTSTNFSGGGVPPGVDDRLADVEELGSVSPTRAVFTEVDGELESVLGVRASDIADLVELEVRDGDLADLAGGLMVHVERADADGLGVGDELEVTFGDGARTLPVVGTFANNDLLGTDLVTDLSTVADVGGTRIDYFVLADAASGVPMEEARAAIEGVTGEFASLSVQDIGEYLQGLEEEIDMLLNVMIGLLALALLIALIGIVNTLALSVFERTRELGLLRAVGMTRRQVRTMVRWEAIITAVFGGLLGVAAGALFGWALVTTAGEAGLQVLEFPVGRLLAYVVLAGVAGVFAAVFPARRAAKLDVLEAVTTE